MIAQTNKISFLNLLRKRDWFLLFVVWAAAQMFLVYYLGINTREESDKYIDVSQQWLQGQRDFNWSTLFYSGYIAIHIVLRVIGLPIKSLYVIQLILSALSAYYLIKTIDLFIPRRLILVVSGILYASCLMIQMWVTALFTDSIFCSLLIIAIYFLLSENRSLKNKIICWSLILILPFFRPVGFLFLLLASVYWSFVAKPRRFAKTAICVVGIILILMIVKKALENPAYYYPNHNLEANVICGYPGNLLIYQKVPYRPGMSVLTYLLDNPNMTIRLFASRFVAVFNMTRSYFSAAHNIIWSISMAIYFILAVLGVVRTWQKYRGMLTFLISGILIFSLPSVLFCQDWSGRFSLPVFCFILLLCCFGSDLIYDRIPGRKDLSD
jgi:hypothetical protein